MNTRKTITLLVALNLVLLFCVAAQRNPEPARDVQPILRARAIELVDELGQVRASLNASTNGETIFRLRDATGTIRVKLGASETGSGLLLLDNTTNPALHILANKGKTTLTLQNKDGLKKVLEP